MARVFYLVFLFGISVSSQENKLFSLLTSEQTGVSFNNKIEDTKESNILLYANFYGGAGVGIGDFNNDGLEDIYFAGNLVGDKLYFNKGDFKFEDVTKASGIIDDKTWSTSVVVADVNNDGYLDIYVTKELYDHKPKLRKNKLYINNGNGSFTDKADEFGVANSERTRNATFFDYNNDGFLDLLVLNQPPNPGSYSEFYGTELLLPKYKSKLYKNINGLQFEDVTEASGLNRASFPNAVSASDLNNDGWTDLYITNDFYSPDFLYMNNGDGTFTDITSNALNHLSYFSMGVDVADINNDGFQDIFVLDMAAEDNFRLKSNMSGMNPSAFWKVVKEGGHYQYMYNSLQLNNGNNTYSEIAQLANIAATDWSWANLIADLDNDGKKDFFITNGLLRDIRNTDASKAVSLFVTETANKWVKDNPNGGAITIWDILDLDKALELLPSVKLSNYAYKNNGDYNFKNTSKDWGLDTKSFSNGAAYADLDNDGDLDLVVNNVNDEAFIYKNNSTNNFLRLALKSKENKPLFGTKATIETDNNSQIIETTNIRGMYSTSEQTIHFGVGSQTNINKLTVKWPDGSETTLENVSTNQELNLYMEDASFSTKNKIQKNNQLLFSDISDEKKLVYKHQENNFDDFEHQVLLPHKMSQFGPALATGDINDDGLEDVFVGASVGSTSQLFKQTTDGNFIPVSNNVFKLDNKTEDIDAVFFDVDNDGDNDLYVVSGGNEYLKRSKNYKDRLYINDGQGNFKKSENSLEISNLSGSVVIPSDYDKDGDIDLFVGTRHTPHEYPLPDNSKLLENIGGKLVDVTNTKAKDLNNLGQVTDAIWTDYDNDNDLDLMIVGEWMPITILKNENNLFVKQQILNNSSGWWFSIEQGDFDKDGDMDYIAGNLGLNYKYKTSPDAPFDVFYNDFDGNGENDIVLGYYNYGEHYPLRGFSCSSQQIPSLKKKIKKYDVFASLDLEGVYGKKELSKSNHYLAKTFATSFIENLGEGNFKISQLPIESQFSSVNDIIVKDFNNDSNLDILLAGNLFVSEIETPRNDASFGLVVLGDGRNNFKSLDHKESGFFARGDVKKLKTIKTKINKLILVAKNNASIQVFKVNN